MRLFASYREAAGTGRLVLALDPGARVEEATRALEARFPGARLRRGLVAVNQEYVGPDLVLQAGDELAFIPPVSGGR